MNLRLQASYMDLKYCDISSTEAKAALVLRRDSEVGEVHRSELTSCGN